MFALQIYFDFSGYSDMAIGLGNMFGFKFKENFNYPYESKSITEFWRRWHISLGSWFKEYVYIPLGGNRRYQVRNMVGILIKVGENKISPETVGKILESKDRRQSGKTAPAVGLYLTSVEY